MELMLTVEPDKIIIPVFERSSDLPNEKACADKEIFPLIMNRTSKMEFAPLAVNVF